MLGVHCKEIDNNINASSLVFVKHDETPAKQNNLTLFEMATISKISSTNSTDNEKCKKFRKLSQKQRKFQDNAAVIASPNSSSSPWKCTFSESQCADSVENSESTLHCDDPINSPIKVHHVWGSPDKTKNILKARQVSESEEKLLPLQHIIAKERIERQHFIKISTKPLKLTLVS